MNNYKWQLRKGSKKERCPECGQHNKFVPYVLCSDNMTQAGPSFGRCERINSCGYMKYPDSDKSCLNGPISAKDRMTNKPHDRVPGSFVEATLIGRGSNVFWQYLNKAIGYANACRCFDKYIIGTIFSSTVFWQMDKDGHYRTGKVMQYNQNGKRNKANPSWYIHKKVKPGFELKQVFFGEHLIGDGSRPIALVESEKTAVMMSYFEPTYVWLAAGGAQMLNTYRLSRLPHLDLVCADNGCVEMWRSKTRLFNPKIDYSVDKAVRDGVLPPGADILDLYLLRNEQNS